MVVCVCFIITVFVFNPPVSPNKLDNTGALYSKTEGGDMCICACFLCWANQNLGVWFVSSLAFECELLSKLKLSLLHVGLQKTYLFSVAFCPINEQKTSWVRTSLTSFT